MLRLITLGRLQLARDGAPSEAIPLQPKRLALLAFLALEAGEGCQQRDRLLGVFWPQSDTGRARRCLRQSLFHLRNQLGDGVILNRGRDGLTLASDRLWCDAVALQHALRVQQRREALDLYAGDFLPGLFVGEGGAELEEWVERTRRLLRSKVVAGAWDLVDELSLPEPTTSALELARRARSLSPDDEHGLRRHMELLARAGDPAAALSAYAQFSRRLRLEYEAEPSAESQALAGSLRYARLTGPARSLVERSRDGRSTPAIHQPRGRAAGPNRLKRLTPVATALVGGFMLAGALTRQPVSKSEKAASRLMQPFALAHPGDLHPIQPRNHSLLSENHPTTGAAMRYSSHLARQLLFPGLLAAAGCGGGDLTLPQQPGPPADLLRISGDSQSAHPGNEVPGPLVVRLVDEQGNAVHDAAVSWVVGDGGGSVSPVTIQTDSAGLASTRLTLGPSPGVNTVNAVVSGVDIVTFSASATGGGGGAGGGGGGGGGNGNGHGNGHDGDGND